MWVFEIDANFLIFTIPRNYNKEQALDLPRLLAVDRAFLSSFIKKDILFFNLYKSNLHEEFYWHFAPPILTHSS